VGGTLGLTIKIFWTTAFLKGFCFKSGASGFSIRFFRGGLRAPRRTWLIVTFVRQRERIGDGDGDDAER
jgi:hypothetical protein